MILDFPDVQKHSHYLEEATRKTDIVFVSDDLQKDGDHPDNICEAFMTEHMVSECRLIIDPETGNGTFTFKKLPPGYSLNYSKLARESMHLGGVPADAVTEKQIEASLARTQGGLQTLGWSIDINTDGDLVAKDREAALTLQIRNWELIIPNDDVPAQSVRIALTNENSELLLQYLLQMSIEKHSPEEYQDYINQQEIIKFGGYTLLAALLLGGLALYLKIDKSYKQYKSPRKAKDHEALAQTGYPVGSLEHDVVLAIQEQTHSRAKPGRKTRALIEQCIIEYQEQGGFITKQGEPHIIASMFVKKYKTLNYLFDRDGTKKTYY
jgi:hypothetical protein